MELTLPKRRILNTGLVRMLERKKDIMVKCSEPYRVEEYGSTKFMVTTDGNKKYYNITGNGSSKIQGFFLSRSAMLDVEKRVDSGLYTYKCQDKTARKVHTIFYNRKNCIRSDGKDLFGVDINSCYWNTARNIGLISERVYALGNKKATEYKNARNVAIGSLGRIKRVEVFDGVDKKVEYYCSETNRGRIDVIDHVFRMALKIAHELGESFCFFLTDCFFVTEEGREKVKEMLAANNYTCKEDLHVMMPFVYNFNEVDTIRWKRLEPKGKNEIGIHRFNVRLDLRNLLREYEKG